LADGGNIYYNIIVVGAIIWGIAGLGLMASPTTESDLGLGLYLLVIQLLVLHGARMIKKGIRDKNPSTLYQGKLIVVLGSIISINIISIIGGLLSLGLKVPKPRLEVPQARESIETVTVQGRVEAGGARPASTGIRGQATPPSRPDARPPTIHKPLEAKSMLGTPIPGFIGEFKCSGQRFRSCLPMVIAPEGLHGCWNICMLGCGGWGCAFLAESDKGRIVFKLPRGLEDLLKGGDAPTVSERFMDRVVKEAEVLSILRHPHLLKLLGYSKHAPILVYEYADYGSIAWQHSAGWRPSARDVAIIGYQIADALRYIHSRGIVHGDIKPSNIFIVRGVVKLGDFSGITRLLTQASIHQPTAYTPGWRAPEQVYADLRRESSERGYENRIDVYQLGNLLLYLLTGEHLDGEDVIARTSQAKAVISSVKPLEIQNLLWGMLHPYPWKRPSTDEIVARIEGIRNI